MVIHKLEGEDQRLYYLVAHLIMDEAVLAYNLNYPYKTSSQYFWFIAVGKKSDTLGFIPVKLADNTATINNYYVADDDCVVFKILLNEIVRTFRSDYEIESVAQNRHVPFFEQSGFSIALHWKRYVKMRLLKNEKERI